MYSELKACKSGSLDSYKQVNYERKASDMFTLDYTKKIKNGIVGKQHEGFIFMFGWPFSNVLKHGYAARRWRDDRILVEFSTKIHSVFSVHTPAIIK